MVESSYEACVRELQESVKIFLTEHHIASRKNRLWGIIKSRSKSGRILVSDVHWEDLSHWFRTFDDWTMVCYMFLISERPLEDWVRDLLTIWGGGVDVQFLERTGRILLNHFEHGIEIIGSKISTGSFEGVARSISQQLDLPLQIRENSLEMGGGSG